jgi:hypothetical protein
MFMSIMAPAETLARSTSASEGCVCTTDKVVHGVPHEIVNFVSDSSRQRVQYPIARVEGVERVGKTALGNI